MKRATILGSGGIIGVAWITGIVEGLREGGLDPLKADTVVGTSAGSIVSTRLTTTPTLTAADPAAAAAARANLKGKLKPEASREIFSSWARLQGPDPKVAARIGALARTSEADGAALIDMYRSMFGDPEWPELDLRIAAVDTESGEREIFATGGPARVAEAVAASTAVPGMFPTVPIGGRHYMDGGVHSTTHADILVGGGYRMVLIAMPTNAVTGGALGVLAQRCLEAELAALREEGVEAYVLMPEAGDREAYGSSLMDASHAESAEQAGRRQASRELSRIAHLWA
ncbi:MAG: patatin-like phospholipase family protein [Myxococcales bacterium]|nr:patatin-like phospholipase family protein [Myxococcales bacterium]